MNVEDRILRNDMALIKWRRVKRTVPGIGLASRFTGCPHEMAAEPSFGSNGAGLGPGI